MNGRGEFQVRLDVIGNNLGELLQTQRGMKAVREEANSLSQALKTGFGIDIAGRINSGLAAVPGIFSGAINRGVQFNATLEQARLGIAAVLKQFDQTGSIKTFDDAIRRSGDAIEILKQKAKESPATFEQLVQTFQAIAGPALAANISIGDTVDLIVNMSQALAGLGIQSSQILQETRALLTGNINADAAAAKILGITSGDINKAKQQGQLYEFLSGKISAFAEAGARGANTLTTASSNLEDALTDLLATATKPIFERLTEGVLDLNEVLAQPESVEALRSLGIQIADLVAAGADLTIFATQNADVLLLLAQAAAAAGLAFIAIKIRDLLVGLGSSARAWLATRLAIEAETVAITRNTSALAANQVLRAELAARPRNFAKGATFFGGLFGAASIATLVLGQQIIAKLEADALARLEREDATATALAKQDAALRKQVATANSLAALAKVRADAEKELKEIDRDQIGIAQLMASDNTAGSSAGYLAELEQLERRRRALQQAVAIIDKRGPNIVASNQDAEKLAELTERQEKAYAAATARAVDLEQRVKALRSEQFMASAGPEGQLFHLNRQLQEINAAYDKQVASAQELPDAEKRTVILKDLQLQADEKRIPLLAGIAVLQKKIGEETEKAAEDATKAADEERKKAAALQDGLAALRLAAVELDRTRIEQNPFLTGAQKRELLAPSLAQENQELTENIALLKARIESGTLDAEGLIATERRLLDLQEQQVGVQMQQLTTGFGGEFQAELTAWLDSFGSNAQQVAGILTGTVGAAIDGISTNLAGAILGTQSWGEAWDNLKLQVAQTFLTMLIRYAATRAAMFVIDRTFGTAAAGAAAAEAMGLATAWAPAAVAASIATLGGAAGVGTAAYLSGVISGTAATVGLSAAGGVGAVAAAEGGLIRGPGTATSDSIPARLSNGEFVVRAAAVDRYGADLFAAFNGLQVGDAGLPVSAGVRGPASAGGGGSVAMPNLPNTTVIVIPDEREATRIARHSAARGDIVRIVREDRDQIFR